MDVFSDYHRLDLVLSVMGTTSRLAAVVSRALGMRALNEPLTRLTATFLR